jgi:hypothetical protein
MQTVLRDRQFRSRIEKKIYTASNSMKSSDFGAQAFYCEASEQLCCALLSNREQKGSGAALGEGISSLARSSCG